MNTKEDEIKLLYTQIITSIIFIITIFISIILSFDEIEKIKDKSGFIDNTTAKKLLRLNKIIVIILLIIYLYISYKTREIDKIKNKNLTPDNLEIIVSILSLIGGIIVLYTIYNYDEDILEINDNPII